MADKGASLYCVQHGGAYKVYQFSFHEFIERKISDSWISAGRLINTNDAYTNNVLGNNLYRKLWRKRRKSNGSNIITFQLYDIYYNEVHINSELNSRLMPEYFKRVSLFFSHLLLSETKNKYLLQAYPIKLSDYDLINHLKNKYPTLKNWKSGRRLSEISPMSKLTILTYFSTGILELAASNIPFTMYLDKRSRYSEESRFLLEQMKDVNLIFYSSETLALFLENTNINMWFYNKTTQVVIKSLIEQLVLVDNNKFLSFPYVKFSK